MSKQPVTAVSSCSLMIEYNFLLSVCVPILSVLLHPFGCICCSTNQVVVVAEPNVKNNIFWCPIIVPVSPQPNNKCKYAYSLL